ncbi:NAD-dependent epimerase/dehydratase family protein [Streptomyces sp. CoH27]|uniref:NAD-dependent epimerase/dehydratase family protein n=1 Tax=Streptomyces sp. CoH27 TaxID=2875763 RepID=UPI001CD56DEA|nr:NAD-dependent epimerase/dehydratase family protein [Streptomyces sp. CoH27]
MRVVVFGASGMVGHGALRACLLDSRVTEVLVVTRRPLGLQDPKAREIIHTDFTDYAAILPALKDVDACFYCLGVSAVGHSEEEYTRITYGYTIAAAKALSVASPSTTFVYVSGEGTDSTEKGRAMWARVKGRTENELLAMPFTAYMFRPGFIQPVSGAVSRTAHYRVLYRLTGRLFPLLRRLIPNLVTTTDDLGRAMISAAHLAGEGPFVLHTTDINRLSIAREPGTNF